MFIEMALYRDWCCVRSFPSHGDRRSGDASVLSPGTLCLGHTVFTFTVGLALQLSVGKASVPV